MKVNRNYKASLFSSLFSDENRIREVYGALKGVPVAPDEPVQIDTLTDVLFMDQVNDLSFTIGNRLVVLIEHQSSINPNMPLRLLLYIARLYERIIDRKNLYTSTQIPVPKPEFYVFYNGMDEQSDRETKKLSDLFVEKGVEPFPLELIVEIININTGHNTELLQNSETLYGYSTFITKGREFYKQTDNLAEAITKAVRWCIREGILVDYLKTNGSEVENMLITEWNQEEFVRVRTQEAIAQTAAKYEAQHNHDMAQHTADQARIAALERQLAQAQAH
jgi:hypothetical protein